MKPLEGIVVLDLTHVLAGPYCSKILCDAGAEVIKIEYERGDVYRHVEPVINGESLMFTIMNGGKRGLTINLKTREGLEIFMKLVARADVLVENLAPGSTKRLGIDYESLRELNQRLVYCSISGYGQTGPWKDKPGFDLIAEAESGFMGLTGQPDGPPLRAGTMIADFAAGIYSAVGILLALRQRDVTGAGQHIDVSLLDSMLAQCGMFWAFASSGFPVQRAGNRDLWSPSGVYRTKDGNIALACLGDRVFENLCKSLGLDGLITDPAFSGEQARTANHQELMRRIEDALIAMETDEAMERLGRFRVPCAIVAEKANEVLENPQVKHRNMLPTVDHPRMGRVMITGVPYKLSECELVPLCSAPLLGEHTAQILRELEYTDDQIKYLSGKKVV